MPEYDRLAIRRADSLEDLGNAEEVVVWRKPDTGPMSQLIWAPELHHIDGKWYIYFAATHTQALDELGCSSIACSPLNAQIAIRSPVHGWKKGKSKPRLTPSRWMPLPLCIRANAGICGRKSPGHFR